jgi:hypothetical protein
VPPWAISENCPIVDLVNKPIQDHLAFAGIFNSMITDFLSRQKRQGANFNFFLVSQLAFPGPDIIYSSGLSDILIRAVARLSFTSSDLDQAAQGLGFETCSISSADRQIALADIHAISAYFYKLTRDELRYILDPAEVMGPDYPSETFRVLKNNEIRQFGEYRTQRLVLEAWDRLFGGG